MPLNKSLHARLRKAFGEVRISNQGAEARWKVRIDKRGQKWATLLPGHAGEEYMVCCPFCSDRRFRLYINHRWDTTDVTGVRFGAGLVCCFNDGCDLNQDAPKKDRQAAIERLQNMLKPYTHAAQEMAVVHRGHAAQRKAVALPERMLYLGDLSSDHPAHVYLLERGFDPAALAEAWSLGWVDADPNPNVGGRLIIPIYQGGELRGFQARYPGKPPADHIPKYYTAPNTPRNQILYGYDAAAGHDYAIMVEGPADAWRLGPPAVALLGCSISAAQIELLRKAWAGKTLFVMLDADFQAKPTERKGQEPPFQALLSKLRRSSGASDVIPVSLPADCDPADMDCETLQQALEDAIGEYALRN